MGDLRVPAEEASPLHCSSSARQPLLQTDLCRGHALQADVWACPYINPSDN